jgi:hypothetical protein
MLLFLYYLNRRFINESASNNFLEFIVHQWFRYGSISVILIFLSVQLGIYSLLNCIMILVCVIAIDIVGIGNILNLKKYYKEWEKKTMRKLLKRMDEHRTFFSWFALKRKENTTFNSYFIFTLIILLAVVTFASRYYFFRYDMYSMSGVWIADLEKVIGFDSQLWFQNDTAVAGDLAFTNFYGKIADVSPEIALQSIGLIESTLISILLFWTIRKITASKTIAPIIASLSFALAYTISPTNVYFLLQNKPIFLGLAFGIPTMVFILKPGMLKFRKMNYFFAMLSVFVTIGLVDLFTLYILLPPFIVLASIFTKRKSISFFWVGVLAYMLAATIVLAIYGLVCIYFETDLMVFLHSNLLSVSSYTYIPQLAIPFDELIEYYQIGTLAATGLILIFIFLKKENWRAGLAFLIYFNLLIMLGKISSSWIDTDMLNQSLSIFMPVVVGISAAAIIRIFLPLTSKIEKLNPVAVAGVVALMLYAAVYYQKGTLSKLTVADESPKQVLEAYDQITSTYFPYSYAVVNENTAQAISTNKHFFMNYSDFLYDYPKQDSIYFRNIKNPKFFKKNPQYVIPKSVLLFVIKSDGGEHGDDGDVSSLLLEQLAMLQKRGRTVRLFYDNKNVKVYEIVNEPKESRIPDLIF